MTSCRNGFVEDDWRLIKCGWSDWTTVTALIEASNEIYGNCRLRNTFIPVDKSCISGARGVACQASARCLANF